MKKTLILSVLSLILLGALFFSQISQRFDSRLHLVACNVGQGDAMYIKTPSGKDILVDGGSNTQVLDCLSDHMPFWDRTIELVILTHPDADHVTGLVDVLQRYTVLHFVTSETSKSTGIYKKFLKSLASLNLPLRYVYANDKIDFGDGVVSNIIWPDLNFVNSSKPIDESKVNEFSVIQVISFNNFKALLTGDAGIMVQDRIAKDAGKVDVLKVPHHGSKTGMSEYYLSTIDPQVAIISVGKNSYGHPSLFSLELLSKYGVKTLRTDRNKEVEVVTDGKSYEVFVN